MIVFFTLNEYFLNKRFKCGLEFVYKFKYNINMNEKIFTAEYTNEALEQLQNLQDVEFRKISKAIYIFEYTGTKYKNINFRKWFI